MQITDWLSKNNKTQVDLAHIIKRYRQRAHRITHGALPNEEEMRLIYEATAGAVTANDFYGIIPKSKLKNGHV